MLEAATFISTFTEGDDFVVQTCNVGAKVWGAITDVTKHSLTVSLPDGLKGQVAAEEVCYTALHDATQTVLLDCSLFLQHGSKAPARHEAVKQICNVEPCSGIVSQFGTYSPFLACDYATQCPSYRATANFLASTQSDMHKSSSSARRLAVMRSRLIDHTSPCTNSLTAAQYSTSHEHASLIFALQYISHNIHMSQAY